MSDSRPATPLAKPGGYMLDEPMASDWCLWLMIGIGAATLINTFARGGVLLDAAFGVAANLLLCVGVVAIRSAVRRSKLKGRPDRPASESATPGWFPDPSGRAEYRRWDGGWNANVMINGVRRLDVVGMKGLNVPTPAAVPSEPAPPGRLPETPLAAGPSAPSPPERPKPRLDAVERTALAVLVALIAAGAVAFAVSRSSGNLSDAEEVRRLDAVFPSSPSDELVRRARESNCDSWFDYDEVGRLYAGSVYGLSELMNALAFCPGERWSDLIELHQRLSGGAVDFEAGVGAQFLVAWAVDDADRLEEACAAIAVGGFQSGIFDEVCSAT